MNARQANRATIQRRALSNGRGATDSTGPVSRNLLARTTTVQPGGNLRNRRAVKMTGAQRDSEGNRSAWAESPDYFTDPKWDQTVTSQHVGQGGYR